MSRRPVPCLDTYCREVKARDVVFDHASDKTWTQRIQGGTTRSPSTFDRRALVRGTIVELEHATDPLVALEIAMDHLDEDPDYYGKSPRANPTLNKAQKREIDRRLHAELARIPEHMRQTGPSYRRRVVEEYNQALFRLSRLQPELAASHVAAAQAAAGMIGDLSTLTYADVLAREQELLGKHGKRVHNPDADACALGRWAWDRSSASCGPGAPPATQSGASQAARRLAQKRWTLPPRERRIAARLLR